MSILVSAVMPCLNEEQTLALCINKAQQAFKKLGIIGEVVVADNGSTDSSVEIAENLGARVIHQSEKGYGAALMAGIEGAHGKIVIMGDSDDSYDWSAIGDFVKKIEEGNDLVMGNRFRGGIEKGAMPWHHRYFGNPMLSFVGRSICSATLGDFYCGMRAFTKEAYFQMKPASKGMEFALEMIVNATRNGLKVAEIPTTLHPDKRNRPPHLRSFRDGWRSLRFFMTYAPDQILLWPGFLLLIPGLILMALLCAGPTIINGFYLGIHFLALGCMTTMLGASTLILWMLSKRVMIHKHPGQQSGRGAGFLNALSLERQLILGLLIMAVGLAIDTSILLQWLSNPGVPMETTVHPAFAATTMVEIGLNLVFSAFVMNLITSERAN